jgi:excinuclease ABC subunit C
MELAARNARHSFDRRFRVLKPQGREMIEALAEAIDLPTPPRRIEAFDVSHLQGTDIVASMVAWDKGRMDKSAYRRFIIKTVPQNDDFASMREVVTRRFRRCLAENGKMPDLILIDGGIGQLHAAADALARLEIINQPLASIAKREETLFVWGREDAPVTLDQHSPALHLVQQIRDEAHRFAVTFHHSRRRRRTLTTDLTNIPGIGERTAQRLLEHFGSVQRLMKLSREELIQVVTHSQADGILSYFVAQRPKDK